MRGRRSGLFLGAIVLGVMGVADKAAAATCYKDSVTNEIICVSSGSGGEGPIGPNWNQMPPERFRQILEDPHAIIRPMRIEGVLNTADKEVIRQALETKRQDFEAFRDWAETDRVAGGQAIDYRKTIDIYKQGIERYRLEMEQIR